MSGEYDIEDLAYSAGLLDGEGCFFFDLKRKKIAVSCSNTDKPTIEKLHKLFGGSFCGNATRLRKPNHRKVYSWQVVSNDAETLCSMLVPFLHQKAEQAMLLLFLHKTRKDRYIDDERERLNTILKNSKHKTWE